MGNGAGGAAVPVLHPWVAAGAERVRFGLVPGRTPDWGRTVELAQTAEALGFDSFWLTDHPGMHGHDCWTLLGGLSQVTRRVRLGSLVSCVLFRHPLLLAGAAAEVDRMSGGRAVLGVGIGDLEREFAQLGLVRAPVPARQRALEEAVGIIRRLWAGEEVTVAGQHFRTEGAVLDPGPVQRPHLPLLLAGGGERVTLQQVARYADASNFGPGTATGAAFTVADVRRKVAALAAHCAAAGRPADAVLRTYFALVGDLTAGAPVGPRRTVSRTGLAYEVFDGPPEAVVAHYRGLVRAGVRYFIFATPDPARVRLLAERVLPHLVSP